MDEYHHGVDVNGTGDGSVHEVGYERARGDFEFDLWPLRYVLFSASIIISADDVPVVAIFLECLKPRHFSTLRRGP